MHLKLLLGHAGSAQGYLYAQSSDGVGGEAGEKSDAPGGFGGVEMRGTWNTMGQLTLVVSSDDAGKSSNGAGLVDCGLVYSGVVTHGQQESHFRGTFGDRHADTDAGSEPAEAGSQLGEFVWRMGRNGAQQRRAWLGGSALRTSLMTFLELHYKQRCELKLRGTRVKRRSLLQKMKNPRTFECVFKGIEADGSDRKGTVTVGAAAPDCSEEVTGFFLYQQGRLMASGVSIASERGHEEQQGSQAKSLYLGVVDMGAAPLSEWPEGKGKEKDPVTGRRGFEWMKDLGKWQVLQGELQMTLTEYAGLVAAEAASAVNTLAETEPVREQLDGQTSSAVSSPVIALGANAAGSQDGVAGGGASKGNWINNGKGKVVDRTRCRIAARGSKAGWRCPNPPMEGGGGLCAFHCKKPRLPGASGSTSAPASPGPAQRNATETVASTRQPRRIIKSSKLLGEDDSDGEQPGSTGWDWPSRAHRKAEERERPWRQGDRAWIMDLAQVGCPIACLAKQKVEMEIESAPQDGTQSSVLSSIDATASDVAGELVGGAGSAGTESGPNGAVETVAMNGSGSNGTEAGEVKGDGCDEDMPSEDDLDDGKSHCVGARARARVAHSVCPLRRQPESHTALFRVWARPWKLVALHALAFGRALIRTPTTGGLPTLDSVDLSMLDARAQANAEKPLAHKNVAVTKASAAVVHFDCLILFQCLVQGLLWCISVRHVSRGMMRRFPYLGWLH